MMVFYYQKHEGLALHTEVAEAVDWRETINIHTLYHVTDRFGEETDANQLRLSVLFPPKPFKNKKHRC